MVAGDLSIRPIGYVRSALISRHGAPRQGNEGAPDAWLELREEVRAAIDGIAVGQEIIVLTWFHRAQREVLTTHPRNDPTLPVSGVFATRSPDRPNPIGLHRVRVIELLGTRIKVGPFEAIDGTPIIDLKPVLPAGDD